MRRKITFKINIEDGTIATDAQGFKGQTCIKETEKLLAGLNAKCQSRNLKPEWNYVDQETGVGQS
jgi:hypothetical protein